MGLCLATSIAIWPGWAAGDDLPAYRLEDVAQHDTLESCWVVIDGQVYDLTTHIPMHPTAPDVLAPWCGGDASAAMRTKGLDPAEEHSAAAWGLLAIYRIGTLAEP